MNNFTSEPVLSVTGLEKSYTKNGKALKILSKVSFNVFPGEWVGVIGQSGSGKTTLLESVSGLLSFDSGNVLFRGCNIGDLNKNQKIKLRRKEFGFIFQNYNLIDSLSVGENIALPLALRREKDIPQKIGAALNLVDLNGYSSRLAGDLSGGEKQRVAIARAVAQDPLIIFADEPTGALDRLNIKRVLSLFKVLSQKDIPILMVTHDLEAAAQCDRVIFLVDGQIRSILSHPDEDQLLSMMKVERDV